MGQEKDSLVFVKNPILLNRFNINSGFFTISKSIKMSVNGSIPNNPIDFGETLGLEKQENTFALNVNWRFSKQKKWSLMFEYFSENNTQSILLEDEVEWIDTKYPVGVQLESGFGFRMFGLAFSRVISTGDKHELGAVLGLHTMDIKTYLQAKAYFGDIDFELDTDKKRVDVIAPIPSIGARYTYAPHFKWSMAARVDWFSITIGDYSGSLWNIAPSVSFQVLDNIGIGIGYKYFETKFNFEKNIFRGSTNLLYQGPLFSLSGTF